MNSKVTGELESQTDVFRKYAGFPFFLLKHFGRMNESIIVTNLYSISILVIYYNSNVTIL
jgi:hypothetical protein